ncbi:MAG: hypothetical protein ACKOLZ_03010, partial [Verrucomicrobiota bacterium]
VKTFGHAQRCTVQPAPFSSAVMTASSALAASSSVSVRDAWRQRISKASAREPAAKAAGTEFALEAVTCFDVFSGSKLAAGSRALAFEMRWRHASRTLTDEEAAKALEAVMTALEKGAGWTVQR